MRTRKHAIPQAVGGLLVATLVLTACAPGSSGEPEVPEVPEVTSLVTAWPTDVVTLDPHKAATDQDKDVTINLYQNLVTFAWEELEDGSLLYDGATLAPELAESWEMEESSILFHLRKDVTFYPSGNPFTAEDVLWSMERAMSVRNMSYNGLQSIDQIEVVDEHTVRVNFLSITGEPAPPTPMLLAPMRVYTTSIVDSVEVRSHATTDDPYALEWLAVNTAGSGPYYIKSRSIGQEMVLGAVEDHWMPDPAFSEVSIRVTTQASVRSLLQGGDINIGLYGLNQNDFEGLEERGFNVAHASTQDTTFFQMAVDGGPFADARVRKAVAHVLPYDGIVESVYFGRAERALSYVNKAAIGFSPEWEIYDADLQKAQDLMEEAGSPRISVPLVYSSADSAYENAAMLIKDALAQIGIEVTLRPQTSAEVFDLFAARRTATTDGGADAPLLMFNASIYTDDPNPPVRFYSYTGGNNNFSRFSSTELDALQDEWSFREADAERDAAYLRIQQIAAEDASFVPLVITGRTVVTSAGLTSVPFGPEISLRYYLIKPVD